MYEYLSMSTCTDLDVAGFHLEQLHNTHLLSIHSKVYHQVLHLEGCHCHVVLVHMCVCVFVCLFVCVCVHVRAESESEKSRRRDKEREHHQILDLDGY